MEEKYMQHHFFAFFLCDISGVDCAARCWWVRGTAQPPRHTIHQALPVLEDNTTQYSLTCETSRRHCTNPGQNIFPISATPINPLQSRWGEKKPNSLE